MPPGYLVLILNVTMKRPRHSFRSGLKFVRPNGITTTRTNLSDSFEGTRRLSLVWMEIRQNRSQYQADLTTISDQFNTLFSQLLAWYVFRQ